MVCFCTRLRKRDYDSLTDDELCLLDDAARSTEPRRLQLRQSRQSGRAKQVHVMVNQVPSAKRPRTSSIIVPAVRSIHQGATKTGKTVTRSEQTIVQHPLGHLGIDQTSRTEEETSQQETSLVSRTTSIYSTEDMSGSQELERSMHNGLSQKTVKNISSMVETISSHQKAWIESTCIFTALLGTKPSGWTVANHSSEAVESTLANTFVQVQVNILQHQIFNKLLAYAANSLWAGKHLGSSENLTKLRRHGSGASEFVRAAGNATSILLLVPPSWLRKSTNEIRTNVAKMKQSAAIFPYLEQFEPLAQTLLDRLKREIETMQLGSSDLLVRVPPVSTQPSSHARESYLFQAPHGTTAPSPNDVSVSGPNTMSQAQPTQAAGSRSADLVRFRDLHRTALSPTAQIQPVFSVVHQHPRASLDREGMMVASLDPTLVGSPCYVDNDNHINSFMLV